MNAFRSLTFANLKMYVRNPIASFSLAAALVLLLVLLKVVFSGQAPHTRVAVVDASHTAASAALVSDLRAAGTFDVTSESPAAARNVLDRGDVDMTLAIPADFDARDASGRPVPVRLQVAYRAGTVAESSLPALRGVVEGYDEVVLGEVPSVSISITPVQARASSAIDFLLPGVVAFNIIGSALMLAAGVFANYKSTGVLRRLKATGISPTVFVLSHAAATFVLGIVQTAAILVVAELLYGVHLDLVALFLLMMLGYLVFLALGLAISGWIRDGQRATAVAQSVAFPMIFIGLLSAALPAGVASVTRYLPVSYVTDGMQRLSAGGQVPAVGADLAWLLGWAAVLLVAAGRVFRWD
ncbi:MAG TPA: ABC transporter permease [Terriglobales bacterium]|nr:ABC transporter permease [Terriglobales bacterium]